MIKHISLATILGLVSMSVFAGDIAIESIDYAKIRPLLPDGWIIKSVMVVDSPTGWRRTKGSKGIQVSFENPTVTIHDQMVGDYHPMYSFALVPPDWEGRSLLGAQFAEGKIQKEERNTPAQVYPDRFQKTYPKFYYFGSYLGLGEWKDPFKDLSKYFENMKLASNQVPEDTARKLADPQH